MHVRGLPEWGTVPEIRSKGNDHELTGYAAVWGASATLKGVTETVSPGAFSRSLAAPPYGRQTVVVDHDDTKLLGSTSTGRARIFEDSTGLGYEVVLPDTSFARDVRALGDAGELSGSSFEFSATKDGAPLSNGKRTLRDVKLFHVSPLTGKTPAYAATTAYVRAMDGLSNLPDEVDAGWLYDALKEGRQLDAKEWRFLLGLTTTIAPEGMPRWSDAADDAASATYAVSTLLYLLGNESDDASQSAHLKTAIAELQAFIAEESAEIGTPDDIAASASAMRSRPNLAAARALFTH